MSKHLNRRILLGILALSGAAAILEIALFRSAWGLARQALAPMQACACAVPGISWHVWTIWGISVAAILGIFAGIGTLVFSILRTRRLTRALGTSEKREMPIVLFRNRPCEAFTFGFWRPRIAICAHCVETLPARELEAMLAHEENHVAQRDPARLLILLTIQRAFFFVPLLKTLIHAYRTATEIAADEHAGNASALGSALLRLAESRQRERLPLAAFASLLQIRIERITNPRWKLRVLDTRALIVTATLFVGLIALLPRGPSAARASPSSCVREELLCTKENAVSSIEYRALNPQSRILTPSSPDPSSDRRGTTPHSPLPNPYITK